MVGASASIPVGPASPAVRADVPIPYIAGSWRVLMRICLVLFQGLALLRILQRLVACLVALSRLRVSCDVAPYCSDI